MAYSYTSRPKKGSRDARGRIHASYSRKTLQTFPRKWLMMCAQTPSDGQLIACSGFKIEGSSKIDLLRRLYCIEMRTLRRAVCALPAPKIG